MAEATLPTPTVPDVPTLAPVPPAASDPMAGIDGWDDEVKRCSEQLGLTDYLPAAIRIVLESFPPGSTVNLYVQWSPDGDGNSVILDARVPCPTKEASERFQHLLGRWTIEMPLHVQMNATVTYCPV